MMHTVISSTITFQKPDSITDSKSKRYHTNRNGKTSLTLPRERIALLDNENSAYTKLNNCTLFTNNNNNNYQYTYAQVYIYNLYIFLFSVC